MRVEQSEKSRSINHLGAIMSAIGGDPAVVRFAARFERDLLASLAAFGCLEPRALLPLAAIKRSLAASGYGLIEASRADGGLRLSAHHQAAVQFVCGYHDLDLRDVAHAGHGWIIVRDYHGPDRRKLLDAMARGELFGIAMTEPMGGTAIRRTSTLAARRSSGWIIRGLKRPISRVLEAQTFIVLCRHRANDGLTTFVVDAHARGLTRRCEVPSGLAGWSWGELAFANVPVPGFAVLGSVGAGDAVIAKHFGQYRLMVAATCLGAGARALDVAVEEIQCRIASGAITKPRDFVLVDLSDCGSALFEASVSTFAQLRQISSGGQLPRSLLPSAKARAVSIATSVAQTAAKILASRGIPECSILSKILRDLRAYEFADGAGDELRRAAGKLYLEDYPSRPVATRAVGTPPKPQPKRAQPTRQDNRD